MDSCSIILLDPLNKFVLMNVIISFSLKLFFLANHYLLILLVQHKQIGERHQELNYYQNVELYMLPLTL